MKFSAPTVMFCVLLLFIASCTRFSRYDRPPKRDAYCATAYHFCKKCNSLQGGIYEKGPFLNFPGPEKEKCIHEWEEISRKEFKRLATEKYKHDWADESTHFWKEAIVPVNETENDDLH